MRIKKKKNKTINNNNNKSLEVREKKVSEMIRGRFFTTDTRCCAVLHSFIALSLTQFYTWDAPCMQYHYNDLMRLGSWIHRDDRRLEIYLLIKWHQQTPHYYEHQRRNFLTSLIHLHSKCAVVCASLCVYSSIYLSVSISLSICGLHCPSTITLYRNHSLARSLDHCLHVFVMIWITFITAFKLSVKYATTSTADICIHMYIYIKQ